MKENTISTNCRKGLFRKSHFLSKANRQLYFVFTVMFLFITSCEENNYSLEESQDIIQGIPDYLNPDLQPFAAWLRKSSPSLRGGVSSEIEELIKKEKASFNLRYSYVSDFLKILPDPQWDSFKMIQYDEETLDIFIPCRNMFPDKVELNDFVLVIFKRGEYVSSILKMLPRDEWLYDRMTAFYHDEKMYLEVDYIGTDGVDITQSVGFIVKESNQERSVTRSGNCWEEVTFVIEDIVITRQGDGVFGAGSISREERNLVCSGSVGGVYTPPPASGAGSIPSYTPPFIPNPPSYKGDNSGNSGSFGNESNYGGVSHSDGDGGFIGTGNTGGGTSGGHDGICVGCNYPSFPDGGIDFMPIPKYDKVDNLPKPSPGIAPKAKLIFRNSNMTEANWKKIEQMLDKIIEHCLGEGLYNGLKNALKGKTLTIQFNAGNGSSFSFDGSTTGINLSMKMESNHLFHEMWHAYQAYQETPESIQKSLLNQEIETWYAQYLYVSSLPEYQPGTDWYTLYTDIPIGILIRLIERHVDNKGNLISDNSRLDIHLAQVEGSLREVHNPENGSYPYKNSSYEDDRVGISNFKNLKKLSLNCD